MAMMEKMARFIDHDIVNDPMQSDVVPPAVADRFSSRSWVGADIGCRLVQKRICSGSNDSCKTLAWKVDIPMFDQEYLGH